MDSRLYERIQRWSLFSIVASAIMFARFTGIYNILIVAIGIGALITKAVVYFYNASLEEEAIRIQFCFHKNSYALLNRLVKERRASSKAQVMWDALALFEWVHDNTKGAKKDCKLLVQRSGVLTEAINPFIFPFQRSDSSKSYDGHEFDILGDVDEDWKGGSSEHDDDEDDDDYKPKNS